MFSRFSVLGALVLAACGLAPLASHAQAPKRAGFDQQRCAPTAAAVDALRRSLRFSLDGAKAKSGAPFPASWDLGRAAPVDHPAFLVIAFSQPVRFRGEGFYALTPGAKAPFEIKQGADRTRLIIPLHVRNMAMRATASVVPILAGELVAEAAVVGPAACGLDRDPGVRTASASVAPGAPQIVVSDQAAVAAPKEVIASPDGGARRIEVDDGRYRLIDPATGAVLADRLGTKPRFSPTGRFAIAAVEDVYEVLDALDGTRVQSTMGSEIAWDNKDSFVAAGFGGNGLIRYYSMLMENHETGELLGLVCRICSAIDSVSFKIDLDRNAALSASDKESAASSLTTGDHFVSTDSWANESTRKIYGNIENFIRLTSKLGNVTLPKRWELTDGLKFTHIADQYTSEPGASDAFATALRKFIVQPQRISTAPSQVASATSLDPFKAVGRGVGEGLSPSARNDRIVQRLTEFGLPVTRGARFSDGPKSIIVATNRAPIDGYAPEALRNDKTVLIRYFGYDECGVTPGPKGDTLLGQSPKIKTLTRPSFTLTLLVSYCEGGSAGFLYPTAALHDSRRPGKFYDLSEGIVRDPNGIGTLCTTALFACAFEAELVADRYLVVWSKESFALAVYDLQTRTLQKSFVRLPSPDQMQHVSLSADRRTLLKTDADGRFALLSLEASQKDAAGQMTDVSLRQPILLEGEIVDDEVVAWTPDGRFDATVEGASYVSVRFPGRAGQYTLEQYRSVLNVPDLVAKTLRGERAPAADVAGFPPSIEVKPTFSPARITGSAAFAAGDVTAIRVFQDGQITDTIPVAAGAQGIALDLARAPGARWVSFVAGGGSRLFSLPATFDAGPPQQPKRRLRVLAIGVDAYDDPQLQDLNFGRKDAFRFHEALVERAATAVELLSEQLLAQTAGRDEVLASVKQAVASGQPGETVVLYFAGHGLRSADGAYYFATGGARVDDLASTAVPWKALADILSTARSRVVIFIDACHSGAAGTDFFATNDASAQALLDRVPTGVLIFSASKGRQLSQEQVEADGGVFTTAVIDAIRGDAADANRNGAIEASEFYRAVKRSVLKRTNGAQTPWFARNEMIGDFGLF